MHTTRGPIAGRMLKLREVAELAGTSPSAIYRLMERRGFPRGMKYGTGQSARRRWPECEVLDWIETQRVGEGS